MARNHGDGCPNYNGNKPNNTFKAAIIKKNMAANRKKSSKPSMIFLFINY
jgi:hypothetical protein